MDNQIYGIIEIEDGGKLRIFQGFFKIPKLELVDIDIPYIGLSTWVRQKNKIGNIKLSFFDCCDDEDFKWLDEWIRIQCEMITGRIGYGYEYKTNINIKAINTVTGDITEIWKLFGVFILSFDTDLFYFHNEYNELILNKLKRKVLFEKINNPVMQISKKIEISIDSVSFENFNQEANI